MTVQPVLPLPAPKAGATSAPTSGVDAEFSALVEQNLGQKSNPAKKSGQGGDPSGTSLGGAPAGHLVPGSGSGDTASDDTDGKDSSSSSAGAQADVATALMAALTGVAVASAAAGDAKTGTAQQAAGSDASTSSTKAVTAAAAASAPTAGADQTTVADVKSATGAADAVIGQTPAQGDPATSQKASPGQGGLDTSGLVPVAQRDQSGAATSTTTAGGDTTDQPSPHAKAAPVESASATRSSAADLGLSFAAPATGPVHAAAPASAGTAAPATVHVPVSDQVFGEVSRLITRGDGTHRITIKLQPEALGDVHVTLSVKDGQMQVDLAADRHAHHALIEGAPELHRLLESIGAKTTDIVVKNLPSFNPNRSDLLGHPGAQHGTGGREQSPDQTAGKQSGDTSARDGGTTGAAAGRQPSPIDPGTRTRIAGVDVTM